jgi:hypothetical protein
MTPEQPGKRTSASIGAQVSRSKYWNGTESEFTEYKLGRSVPFRKQKE